MKTCNVQVGGLTKETCMGAAKMFVVTMVCASLLCSSVWASSPGKHF
jgi:hypothetical protein